MNGTSITIDTTGALTAFETVLDVERADTNWVTYSGRVVDDIPYATLIFSRSDYDELGQPQEVTVRVRPGNTLSAEIPA